MPKTVIRLLLLTIALLAIDSQGIAAEEGGSFFTVSGDVSVTVEEATAQMVKIGNRIPAITISSSPSSIRKLGTSYNVNLFFSGSFDPKPGKYPVAFSYRKKINTLGGSFRQRVMVKGEAVCARADIF